MFFARFVSIFFYIFIETCSTLSKKREECYDRSWVKIEWNFFGGKASDLILKGTTYPMLMLRFFIRTSLLVSFWPTSFYESLISFVSSDSSVQSDSSLYPLLPNTKIFSLFYEFLLRFLFLSCSSIFLLLNFVFIKNKIKEHYVQCVIY